MMTKLNLMKPILTAVCAVLFSFNLSAQVVKDERLLSSRRKTLPEKILTFPLSLFGCTTQKPKILLLSLNS